jgi:hypothetical protein
MIIACMCTFPARGDLILPAIDSLYNQVDKIRLCLNEYTEIPSFLDKYEKLVAIIPDTDQRDVGKFLDIDADDEDIILYVDDDIIYPENYASVMCQKLTENDKAVYGLHGVIYPDTYDGDVGLRRVFSFPRALEKDRLVNQIGTGTVAIKAKYRPKHSFMKGSQKFVDVRFAVHCFTHGIPIICIARGNNWLAEIKHGESIFSTFTKKWPLTVTMEVQTIAGYSKLNEPLTGSV